MQPVDRTCEMRNLWGFFLLCILVIICYSNTFKAGWHLDDNPNILTNSRLHIDALSIDSLKQSFSALHTDPGNKIWRPLPCLSLALNWYWGKDDPLGYHWVNLILHMISACFLFLTVKLLLITPAIRTHSTPWDNHAIALLVASFWAVNPIQTQAVTYIVQRMAVMAAMFSIIGLYAYLKGRLAEGRERWVWFIAVVISFICALLSKENAVLFPFSVMLIEYIFFRRNLPVDKPIALLTTRNVLIAGFLMTVVAFIVLNIAGNPINFEHFGKRPFSLWERLLSQPRILVFYLSLIFYPAPWRLSIEHEINHSLSLFTPWTTLPAFFTIVVLVLLSIRNIRKAPLLSFGILFYFVNHLVESTILPLELVFEHRNYLPSFFIFLPVAFYVNKLVVFYRFKSQAIFILLALCMTVVLTATGFACYERNKAWKSDYSLWYDAIQKAPGRARSLMALGVAIGWGEKDITNKYDIALGLFNRALKLPRARKNETTQIYGNIALAHLMKGDLSAALDAYDHALKNNPQNRKIRFDLLDALIANGKWNEALEQSDILIAGEGSAAVDLNYKGLIKLWMGKPEDALALFQEALAAGLHDPFLYHNMGAAMTGLGDLERGRWFLKRALELVEQNSRGKILIYLSLVENRYKAKDEIGARGATYELLAGYGLDEVINTLKGLPKNHTFPPLDIPMVSRLFGRYLEEIAFKIGSVSNAGLKK